MLRLPAPAPILVRNRLLPPAAARRRLRPIPPPKVRQRKRRRKSWGFSSGRQFRHRAQLRLRFLICALTKELIADGRQLLLVISRFDLCSLNGLECLTISLRLTNRARLSRVGP